MIHVIKEGDNLYQLSRQYRVPLALIMRANPYVDVYNLQVGQEICIPVGRPSPGIFPLFGGMRPPMGRPPVPPEPPMGRPPVPPEPPMGRPPVPPEPPRCCEDGETDRTPTEEREEEQTDAGENMFGTPDVTETVSEEYVYIPEEKISLGEVLERWNMTMGEFMEKNGPENIYLAEGCTLYLEKKV